MCSLIKKIYKIKKYTSAVFSVSSIRAVHALKSKELALTMLHNRSSSADMAATKSNKERIFYKSKH